MTTKWPVPNEIPEFYQPKIGPMQGEEELTAQIWFDSYTPGQRAEVLVRARKDYMEQQQRALDTALE